MVEQAVAHLVRWEQRYGWTRRGEGWVSEREASLASTQDLSEWNDLLVAHLDPVAHAVLLDRLPRGRR